MAELVPPTSRGTSRLRARMTRGSRLRYLAWRAARARWPLTVKLQEGERMILRPAPAGDLSVAYEIFVDELYRSPRPLPPDDVRTIIDVGANVGYALTWLAHRFRNAAITAFEPHPTHLRQLARNVAMNGLGGRVRVIPAAAGTSDREAFLVDAGEASRVVESLESDRIPITVMDFFGAIGDKAIDLLKLDCEGAEYALLMDTRFAQLSVNSIALEWHADADHPRADEQIKARLLDLGYALEIGRAHRLGADRFGMIWAYRH